MKTAAEKFDLVPPWCSTGHTSVMALPAEAVTWARADGSWADDGWREKLQTRGFGWGGCWLYTPCGRYWWGNCTRKWEATEDGDARTVCDDTSKTAEARRICTPPPNLAKPDADAAHHGNLAEIADAVPPTYRVGDDVAAWVRNLAAAHEQALAYQRGFADKLAAAQSAAVAAEGRAELAKKRASKAEDDLADLRNRLEKSLAPR